MEVKDAQSRKARKPISRREDVDSDVISFDDVDVVVVVLVGDDKHFTVVNDRHDSNARFSIFVTFDAIDT